MNRQKTGSSKAAQQGVVLVEAMIAILIFSMGVLAIVGLQAAMLKNTADSKYRADASYIAQQQIGLMWSEPDNLPADGSTTVTDISAVLPGGSLSVIRDGVQFTVAVTWEQPGEAPHNFTTIASIVGG
ncbi:MAG TPA: prepilin-type cleavage/methylation domain-containing protein [Gallionella sp.]|nr:prepilin-type cleavage/methylation domain-containing protein [Gallionella sp.]